MERKFIVIHCRTLGDQFECDADRTIEKNLLTLTEIEKILSEKVYRIGDDGEWYKTEQDAYNAFAKEYENDKGWLIEEEVYTLEDAIEYCGGMSEKDAHLIEVYEIMDDSTLKFREDLTNYE